MRNYTYILNEGFSKYFNKLNEEADNDELDIESTDKTLDEAVPRDLMDKIKNTKRYRVQHNDLYDPIDYASADMQEISASDVMRMKKAGEDLNDIYVLNDYGDLVQLDRYGHPIESGSTGYPRANQSLSKTLSNAVKIYKGKIDYFSRTQPDKYEERTSDEYRRYANRKLGSERWNKEKAKEFRRRLEGPAEEIAAVRKEYEDGDISRKEMEARIAELKDIKDRYEYKPQRDDYYTDAYNRIKQDRADARYYDSNKAARKNMDAYEEAKSDLDWAQDNLQYSEEKLVKAQAGEGRGSRRVSELKGKIASLKRELASYEQELAENPEQKELNRLQRDIDDYIQRISDNQAIIDKLLHRNKNESLKKKYNKR